MVFVRECLVGLLLCSVACAAQTDGDAPLVGDAGDERPRPDAGVEPPIANPSLDASLPDAMAPTMGCDVDADCDDGIYCNGAERCLGEFGCDRGREPCQPGETCDEVARSCTAPTPPVDVPPPGTPPPDPFDDEIGDSSMDPTRTACYPAPTYCDTVTVSYSAPSRGRILLVGEGDFALRFACMLRSAGFSMTRLIDEADLDATIDLSPYAAIVTLDGTEWGGDELSTVGQQMLVDYVQRGGGYVAIEWALWQSYPVLGPMLPTSYSGWTTGTRTHRVTTPGHPIVAGLPGSYSVTSHGYSYGAIRSDATALISDEDGHPSVAIRPHGSGRVGWFAAANNYSCFDWLSNPELNRVFVRTVAWAANEASLPDVVGGDLGRVCSCAGP